MSGFEIGIGYYTGILIGVWTDKFKDGYKTCIYLPFAFIEFNTYYEDSTNNKI